MKLPDQTRAFAIYVFGPCPDGKFYVGQTEHLPRRFNSHAKALGECPEFHRAIKLFGIDAFPIQIVAETDVAEESDRLESLFITKFNALIPHGYNLTTGGRGVRFEPGAKVVGFTEHPVGDDEIRAMAHRMADVPKSECPCCGGFNDGAMVYCDCGVAPVFTRLLLRCMAQGGGLASLPLSDDANLVQKWRASRDADFFILCEKRGVKGRTIAGVGPVAMQKYAARFWPYLECAVRRRCLTSKKLPSYTLGRFRPLPGGKVVEMAKLTIERLLRKNRRELGPGEQNVEVFAGILKWQKEDNGKIFDAVIATLVEHGGSDAEISEARRRVPFYREVERELPDFLFLGPGLGYLSFVSENWLAYIGFTSRPAIEDPLKAIIALPVEEHRAALMTFLESPPAGVRVNRMTRVELDARIAANKAKAESDKKAGNGEEAPPSPASPL